MPPLRSLKNLRTLSSGPDEGDAPHRAYMKLSCLEQEKLRRIRERERAQRWVDASVQRLEEIEEEMKDIHETLRGRKKKGRSKQIVLPPAPAPRMPREKKAKGKGLKFKVGSALQWSPDGLKLNY